MGDNIKKPDHYCEGREYEPKDVIRDWGLNFNLGSAVKYISRAGRKGDILEDLKKAKQFLEFEIEAVEEENDGASRELFYKSLEGIDEYSKKVLNEEDEKRISAELLSMAVTRSENPMKFEDVPESLKPRVINNIAQEVLDSQIIPPDEVRAAVIDRIVERIENGELDCFDISTDLYCGYQDIRDAIARQAFRKVGEEQKSDIGMSCKEAAEIGDAIAKGFKEGFKEAEEKHDESELDIYCRGFDAGYDMAHTDLSSVEDTFTISFKIEED